MKATLLTILIFATATVSVSAHATRHEWVKPLSAGHIERGLMVDINLGELGGELHRIALACADNETLVSGRCQMYYGLTQHESRSQTLRVGPTRWLCTAYADLSTAMNAQGYLRTEATPINETFGSMSTVIDCQVNP